MRAVGILVSSVLWVLSAVAAPVATYLEPYRPQYHFSPARNWLNDPNGLIYADGEYHLFFQYNPQGDKWGHMNWGHAVSADLLHWRELPVAIPEDEQGMIFSGSVVSDSGNTSGFGRDGKTPLVAIYTSASRGEGAAQRQHIAYSLDAGRTWTKYAGNPVLDIGSSAFRDPKVFRYEPSHEWLMAVSMADRHQVAFYASRDLKTWTHLSDFGPAGAADGAWECPDLFELPVDGNPADTRWVLKMDVFRSATAPGSGTQAFIGRFDGVRFTPDADPAQPGVAAPPHAVDYGMDFYAALSWENLPAVPARRVWLAWMNSHHYAQEIPTAPWRGAMSLPREVTLHAQDGALRLRQAPARELTSLRGAAVHLGSTPLGEHPRPIAIPPGSGKSLEIRAVIELGTAREAGLKVHVGPGEETLIGYDTLTHTLYIDRARSGKIPAPLFAQRRSMPLPLRDGRIELRVFVDASSVEVFANDGEGVMTEQVFASPRSGGVQAYAVGGRAQLVSMQAWALRARESRQSFGRQDATQVTECDPGRESAGVCIPACLFCRKNWSAIPCPTPSSKSYSVTPSPSRWAAAGSAACCPSSAACWASAARCACISRRCSRSPMRAPIIPSPSFAS